MHWTRRDLADPSARLRRMLQHGKRWCQIYWLQTFQHAEHEVNAAAVPMYLIQQIEREDATIEDVVCGLARSSSRTLTGDAFQVFPVFHALWDEAVTYVVGVRQDILRASAAGEFALIMADQGRWMDAFRAAHIAYDIEWEHAGEARYWHPFLYSLVDVLVRSGYGRNYNDLRRKSKATSRTSNS